MREEVMQEVIKNRLKEVKKKFKNNYDAKELEKALDEIADELNAAAGVEFLGKGFKKNVEKKIKKVKETPSILEHIPHHRDTPALMNLHREKQGVVTILITAADCDGKHKKDKDWYWEFVGNRMLAYPFGRYFRLYSMPQRFVKAKHAKIIYSKEIRKKHLSKVK